MRNNKFTSALSTALMSLETTLYMIGHYLKRHEMTIFEWGGVGCITISRIIMGYNSPIGWYVSMIGCVLSFMFNKRIGYPALMCMFVGLFFLSINGAYKWHHDIAGLQTLDKVVATIAGVYGLIVIFIGRTGVIKSKRPFGIPQAIIVTFFPLGFVCLGLRTDPLWYNIGWILVGIGHATNVYMFWKSKRMVLFGFQIILTLTTVFKLLHLFILLLALTNPIHAQYMTDAWVHLERDFPLSYRTAIITLLLYKISHLLTVFIQPANMNEDLASI